MISATKTIKEAIPTVRISDNIVLSWKLTVMFTYLDYSKIYTRDIELEDPIKTVEQFTQQDLISSFPEIMDRVFDSQYTVYLNTPILSSPTETTISSFDVSSLS